MGKPRRQTYTLEMYLKKLKDQDIRQDQDVQRLSDQWSNAMMNELIITVLNDGYIPQREALRNIPYCTAEIKVNRM